MRVVLTDNFMSFEIGASRHAVGPLGVMITPHGAGTSALWHGKLGLVLLAGSSQ